MTRALALLALLPLPPDDESPAETLSRNIGCAMAFGLLLACVFMLLLVMLDRALAGALIIPPEEYDKPYDGELYERTVPQSEIRARCPSIKMKFALGCSVPDWIGPKTCLVLIAPDKDMKAASDPAKGHYFTRENVRRHELGHCNGWPADHKGAREAK